MWQRVTHKTLILLNAFIVLPALLELRPALFAACDSFRLLTFVFVHENL